MTYQGVPTDYFEKTYRGETPHGQVKGQAADGGGTPIWDMGQPQPPVIALESAGKITGKVLDAGCGTGDVAVYLAHRGYPVTAFDVAPTAVERARKRAEDEGVTIDVRVVDALRPSDLKGPFDTILDVGLFHLFDDADREKYNASLQGWSRPGTVVHLVSFSDLEPPGWGPRRVTEGELRDFFGGPSWRLDNLERTTGYGFTGEGGALAEVQAWLATATAR